MLDGLLLCKDDVTQVLSPVRQSAVPQLCMNKMDRRRINNGLALELSMCMEDVLSVDRVLLANPLWGSRCIGAVATIKERTVDLTTVVAMLQRRSIHITLPRA